MSLSKRMLPRSLNLAISRRMACRCSGITISRRSREFSVSLTSERPEKNEFCTLLCYVKVTNLGERLLQHIFKYSTRTKEDIKVSHKVIYTVQLSFVFVTSRTLPFKYWTKQKASFFMLTFFGFLSFVIFSRKLDTKSRPPTVSFKVKSFLTCDVLLQKFDWVIRVIFTTSFS